MVSKEEAEEKLLKIFFDVKLDSYFDLYPTSVAAYTITGTSEFRKD